MSLHKLHPNIHVVHNHEGGIIFDKNKDRYISLNTTASLILQSVTSYSTLDEVLYDLGEKIDATNEELISAISMLIQKLQTEGLLLE